MVTNACEKLKSKPITRSNYLPSAFSWQPLARLLPELCFTNTLIQKAPSQREKALLAQSSCKVSQHQDRAQEFNARNFKALSFEPS